jgi:transketolase
MLESINLMPKSLEELQVLARRIRREIIEMIGTAKSGHPGGSLSAVELLVELYFDYMRIDPKNPKWPDRDRFILSKGHACPVLYCVMAEAGYSDTPLDKLNTLRKMGSMYQGHPDVRFIPSLEASTGSLGEGLSLALGMGLAARLDGRAYRTYCMLGDGEIQEGQVWESAMAGAYHKLDNVVAIVDYNGIQLDGFVKDIMEVAPLADKWRAFGWHTVEINGHDIPSIKAALQEAENTKGKPSCIVAHTVKGKGVSFMENNPKFHGTAPTPDEMKLALQELR